MKRVAFAHDVRAGVPGASRALLNQLLVPAAFAAVAFVSFRIALRYSDQPPALGLALAGGFVLALYCFTSTRYALILGGLMVYLGLAEGFLKLRYGGDQVTALRDVILLSVTAGALVRLSLRGTRVPLPPLTPIVALWVLLVLVQFANPRSGTLTHSVFALRQHIEWVPLFFFGYVLMRDKRAILTFLTIILVLAAVNGAVSLYQYQAGPDVVAGWGPGYDLLINGSDGVSGRTFTDSGNDERLRPPALGSDVGFGGALAVLGGPAAFVFLFFGRRRLVQATGVLMAGAVVIAAFASQVRLSVVGLAVAVVAVLALSAVSKRLAAALPAVALVGVVTFVMIGVVSGYGGVGVFDRYTELGGSDAVQSTTNYKSGTLALVPEYAEKYTFGAGLGVTGPASSKAGGGPLTGVISGESEFNFLIAEVGVPGFLTLLALLVIVILGSTRRIRRIQDPELRLLLSALVAPLIALAFQWFGGPVTASPPSSPYFWFVCGVLAYWCFDDPPDERDARPGAGRVAAAA